MEPEYSLKNLFSDLEHFQKVMSDACTSLSRPEERQKVQELLDQFATARAEAEKEIPQILEEKLKNAQAAQTECEALIKEVEQAQKDLEERLKAPIAEPPAPPSPPDVHIDPAHGERLQNELLNRYVAPLPQPVEHGNVWSHMEGVTSAPVPPAPPPRSAAPPPRPKSGRPAPVPGSIWSQMEGLIEPAPEEKKEAPKKPDHKGKPPEGWDKTSQVE